MKLPLSRLLLGVMVAMVPLVLVALWPLSHPSRAYGNGTMLVAILGGNLFNRGLDRRDTPLFAGEVALIPRVSTSVITVF